MKTKSALILLISALAVGFAVRGDYLNQYGGAEELPPPPKTPPAPEEKEKAQKKGTETPLEKALDEQDWILWEPGF